MGEEGGAVMAHLCEPGGMRRMCLRQSTFSSNFRSMPADTTLGVLTRARTEVGMPCSLQR